MSLKMKRRVGQSLSIGNRSTVIHVDLLDGNSAIIDVSGAKRRLELGRQLKLEKGKIIMTLETIEPADNKVLFDFVQSGDKKDWLSIKRL